MSEKKEFRANGREKTSSIMRRQREQRAAVKRAFLALSGEEARALQQRHPDLFAGLLGLLDGPEMGALSARMVAAGPRPLLSRRAPR